MRCLPLFLLPALVALGDEVRLKNGSVLVGEVRLEGGNVVVNVGPGTVTVPAREVLEIRRGNGAVEPPAPRRSVEDAVTREAVERELRGDPVATEIAVDVRDGVATLRGRAKTLAAVDRVAALASIARGVRDVRREVEIEGRPDEEIRAEVGEAEVRDGIVTARDRAAAEEIRSVRGVKDVRIEAGPARPDEEIRKEIDEILRWDAAVDHGKIHVAVRGGAALLTGVVPSAAEKFRAIDDAWRAGALAVDASALEVDGWERDPSFRRGKFERVTDAEIEAAVRRRLGDVEVYVRGGDVELRGQAPTLRAARRAGREARSVVGVRRVENRLTPRPGPAGDVGAALRRDPFVEEGVTAEVNEGVARLTGVVGSTFAKASADERAAAVPGIRAVENALEVAAPGPLAADPYVDGLDARDYAWSPAPPRPSPSPDAELRDEIERRFAWSPFVDGTRVRVAVLDGQAILSGAVDSLVERDAAERVALKAGAPVVVNRVFVN